MDREQRVCPDCGQPVQSVIRRHKTLGAWVPRWVPGPCHNPECEAYVEPGAQPDVPEPEVSRPEVPGSDVSEPDVSEPGQEPGTPTVRSS
ncbi:hypothetical protein OG352_28980 [Streptomyces sp. NBC_01485]|uniref:hypothetical protein n=1 Tax=Streptomyces sp. NBC_01485 TaxID=2903884 RepID=UPI002E32EE04|nr:hypothetical protein [Streptomyces sp. NBC_01485]